MTTQANSQQQSFDPTAIQARLSVLTSLYQEQLSINLDLRTALEVSLAAAAALQEADNEGVRADTEA